MHSDILRYRKNFQIFSFKYVKYAFSYVFLRNTVLEVSFFT